MTLVSCVVPSHLILHSLEPGSKFPPVPKQTHWPFRQIFPFVMSQVGPLPQRQVFDGPSVVSPFRQGHSMQTWCPLNSSQVKPGEQQPPWHGTLLLGQPQEPFTQEAPTGHCDPVPHLQAPDEQVSPRGRQSFPQEPQFLTAD
jgi:hypothetical protein